MVTGLEKEGQGPVQSLDGIYALSFIITFYNLIIMQYWYARCNLRKSERKKNDFGIGPQKRGFRIGPLNIPRNKRRDHMEFPTPTSGEIHVGQHGLVLKEIFRQKGDRPFERLGTLGPWVTALPTPYNPCLSIPSPLLSLAHFFFFPLFFYPLLPYSDQSFDFISSPWSLYLGNC